MNLAVVLLPFIAFFQPAGPKFSAKLYAADGSIQPGGQTHLAIELNVEKSWHIYHPLVLDTGAPTDISFTVPKGVTLGELRFPAPTLGVTEKIEYFALDQRTIVLTTLTLAEDVTPGPLTIAAHVRALACKELCVPVKTDATLTLTVATSAPTPANTELFKEAREALPAPLEKAKYIEGSRLTITPEKLTPDGEATIELTIRVKKGHHVQDRDPGNELLIPSRLFIESLDGLKFGPQKWPEAHVRDMPGFGKVREQSGEFKVQVPVRIDDAQFTSGPIALRALFTYQTCTDAGTCYPPETAEAALRFTAETPNRALAEAGQRGSLMPAITIADHVTAQPPESAGAAPPAAEGPQNLLYMLLLSFVGGLILNVMPCVFPVISIKILSFVKQAGDDRGRVLRLGLAFAAGIMVWFWIFAGLTSIGEVPWQHPAVVILLTAILFVFALNLFGVFEITLPGAAATKLDEAATREGYTGAFLKGLLATLLGTACTAPFFATAAAYAATQGRAVAFIIFTGAGLGMSAPYVLLSAYPGWLKALPRPGQWMVTFKQAMGFVLLGTAVWLLLVVADLLDARAVVWTLAFLCFLGFAAWLIGKIGLNWSRGGRALTWLSAIVVIMLGWWFSFPLMYGWPLWGPPPARVTQPGTGLAVDPAAVVAAVQASDWNDHVPWQPYYPGLPEELARRGYTVYVDFTATWCVTCQTNKATAIEIDSTRTKMRSLGVIPLKADYTKRDPAIREKLLAHGRNSVPLNLLYPARQPEAVIELPVVLTPGTVANALDKAGPSTAVAAVP